MSPRVEKLKPQPDLKAFGVTMAQAGESMKQMADAFQAYTVTFASHHPRQDSGHYATGGYVPALRKPDIEIRTPREEDSHGCWRLSYYHSPAKVANRQEQVEILIDHDMEWVLQTARSLLLNRVIPSSEQAYLDWVSTPY